ncbi:MAG: hypothetical protein ACI9BW_004348 [Gammaproteobacteria bacterium]
MLFFPVAGQADDLEKGRIEVGQILDGIFNSHFRRSMRARAALYECDLDDKANELVSTQQELDRGSFQFSKEVFASESLSLKAYLESIGITRQNHKGLDAIYSVAHLLYFSDVVYGASGGLVLVNERDKKSLCGLMLKEAENF